MTTTSLMQMRSGALATTKHAAGPLCLRPITSLEMPVSRLPAVDVLAAVDLRGVPVSGAQCRFDPELHTGPDGVEHEDAADRAVRELVAAEVCGTCPLRAACLSYAARTRPAYGVWGGLPADRFTALPVSDVA
ncbi:WhiB family transcriptional regulator [Actinomadura kijaniata]|uniref:WhiB family transcriptional regulator n=1 Tax=Actinomadura kijaniata TaxID=46161 RepID=UPI003F1B1D93